MVANSLLQVILAVGKLVSCVNAEALELALCSIVKIILQK